MKRFAVAHGPQILLLAVGLSALVLAGVFFFGGDSFGLKDSFANKDDKAASAQLQQSDSIASIKAQDGDKDGLSDLDERLYRSDPTKPDTDGDGYKDGDEVKNGYDPTSKLSAGEAKKQDESKTGGSAADQSLLGFLGVDTSGATQAEGGPAASIGGLGGFSPDQLEQLGKQTLPDGQRIADLEVDQVLSNASQPLPSVDIKSIKTNKETSLEAERRQVNEVYKLALENNPFPAGYSLKEYLTDVESNNRDLFERMKLTAETLIAKLSEQAVPKSLAEEQAHALSILLASKDALQKVLDADGSPDSILDLLGRSFFVMGEVSALLQEVEQEVQP
ncbi:MAG: hypothetical protein V1895_00785 [Parcubacteria group bacterium]